MHKKASIARKIRKIRWPQFNTYNLRLLLYITCQVGTSALSSALHLLIVQIALKRRSSITMNYVHFMRRILSIRRLYHYVSIKKGYVINVTHTYTHMYVHFCYSKMYRCQPPAGNSYVCI